jgi:hypothetical protein
MSKLDYTFLLFGAVMVFAIFCLWFNSQITRSNVAKRITWYSVWGSFGLLLFLLFLIWVRMSNLKGG